MSNKVIYLTTNKGKFEEAKRLFEKNGIDIEIATPDFEIPEIHFNSVYHSNRLLHAVQGN